jgi:peroxiredoxin
MRLSAGMAAPPLETTDFLGNPVSLAMLEGRSVLLSF